MLAVSPPAEDATLRLDSLTAASKQYSVFLLRCRQYGLLSGPARALADAALQRADGTGAGDGTRVLDPTTLRQNKIEKFKRERVIKGRLEELEQRQRLVNDSADEEADGEETERELWLLQADMAALQVGAERCKLSGEDVHPLRVQGVMSHSSHCCCCTRLARLAAAPAQTLIIVVQAADRLSMLQQEVLVLRHAIAIPEDQRQRQREQRQEAGPPSDLLRQLQAAAGNLGSAAMQRQRLAAGVLQPSHVLPTLTVEQFGEIERRRWEQPRLPAWCAERLAILESPAHTTAL